MEPLENAILQAFSKPSEKQEKFYASQKRYVGYGGAKFGGKSHGMRMKATMMAYEHPGIQMLLVRRTLPELRENHVLPLQAAYSTFPEAFRPKYREGDAEFWYPTGARLKLGYCKDESDVSQYQGQAYDVLFMDEATLFTEVQFFWLDMVVGRREGIYPQRTYLSANPGGVGHAWVKKKLIDKPDENTEFIFAYAWDNLPMLMKDKAFVEAANKLKAKRGLKIITPQIAKECILSSKYAKQLSNLPETLREALLYGRWDVYAGQYFSEWDPKKHVCKKFDIPAGWYKTCSLDYGLDMFAVLWYATNPEGYSFCYRELRQPNLTIPAAAIEFQKHTDPDVQIHYAPPDMWNRRQDSGRSMADMFGDYGIPLVKASNERAAGCANMKEHFEEPRLVIMDSCPGLIEDLPLLQTNPKKPDEYSTEPHEHTHAPDALRYWCVMRKLTPTITKPKQPDPFHLHREEKTDDIPEDYFLGGYRC